MDRVCVCFKYVYVCVHVYVLFQDWCGGGECMKAKSVKKYICPADVNLLDRSP